MASHSNVAHAWAHQTGRHCNGGSGSYRGGTAYSYGTPIAQHATTADGASVVLITSVSYSVTTSQFRNLLWEAVNHLRRFEVPDVCAASTVEHLANREFLIARAIDAVQRSARARTQAASWLDKAQRAVDDANAYAAAFGLAVVPVEFDNLHTLAAEAERRAQVQREAEQAARRRTEALTALSIRDKVRAWLRGEPIRVHTRTPMVRVVGDRIETTWGASASLPDALKAYRAAKICRRTRTAMEGPSVDQWGTARIDERGTITVGCHRIPFRLAQLAACLAGLEKASA